MSIDLRHGRYQGVMRDVTCDACISDQPYSARTHDGQSDLRDAIGYACWTPRDVYEYVEFWASRTRSWMASLTDDELAPHFRAAYETAGRLTFASVPCIAHIPRLSGDGPGSATIWLMVSRPREKRFLRWGSLPGWYEYTRERGAPVLGAKPLDLMRQIIRDYSRPGDLVCDPCGGGFTTAIAAHMEGRRAVSAERSWATFEKGCARAEEYLRQVPLFERVESAEPKQEVFAL